MGQLTILLHSSKTMRSTPGNAPARSPHLSKQAAELATYLRSLNTKQLCDSMKISSVVAQKTAQLYADWSLQVNQQTPAIDCFRGDIYSGLQAQTFNAQERAYADKHLVILSGLYGCLRALDGIMPYRLEMMYKFPEKKFTNLYNYWGTSVADVLPNSGLIINTSSVEYSKLILPYVEASRVVTPQFYTVSPKTGKPTFVTVHSKIARGAFARWLITTKAQKETELVNFDLLGYTYSADLSRPNMPAFVTKEFGGIGLSIRLQD